MWMFLRKTLRSLVLVALVPCQLSGELCLAEDESGTRWLDYPAFCGQFGLGTTMHGGTLRYRHEVDGNIIEVMLVDSVTILTIGVLEDDGKINRSQERVNQVVSRASPQRWRGDSDEAILELKNWLGKSHLPFENRFDVGLLFDSSPRSYFHSISELKVVVIVDQKEVILAIKYFDSRLREWVSIKAKSETK